jgi:hypothetical protein
MPDSSTSNNKLVGFVAWAVPIGLSAVFFYVQLQVWKEEGHDHMLTVTNFVVTVLLWASLAWLAYRNFNNAHSRASYLQGQVDILKQTSSQTQSAFQQPSRLSILSAHWGVEGINDPDVTPCLLKKQRGDCFAEAVVLDLFHGRDPVSGNLNGTVTKRLKVRYSFDGKESTIERPEFAWMVLPEDKFLKEQVEECGGKLSKCETERNDALNRVSDLEKRLAKFSLLQVEALEIERDLGVFLQEIGPRPSLKNGQDENQWRSWYTQLTMGYNNQFAPRIEKLILNAAKQAPESRLGLDGSGIKNDDEIRKIRVRLVRFAYEQDGLPLEVRE